MFGYDIKKATVSDLHKGLKNKDFSALELAKAYLSRAKELQPKLSAFITLCEESALEDAKKADERIYKGEGTLLTGIPLGIKDNICTEGVRTTCASKMLEDFIPPYSATAAERLKAQNVVLLGKTNLDEFAMGSTSETSFFGGVRNPYDESRVAGGSSGGSAAAVAAGLCPVALGSDTGGSIRQPAAFCGVTGIKPTYGTVSRYGLVAFASSLDQIGPIGRNAEDCAFLLNAIAGADALDATCSTLPRPDYTSKLGKSINQYVVGVPSEFFGDNISDEVKCAVHQAAKELEKLGCTVKTVSLPSLKYAVAAYYLLSSAEAASNLSRYDGIKYGHRNTDGVTYEEQLCRTRSEGFGWEVKRRIMLGNYALSSGYYEAYYKKATQIRAKLRTEFEELFKGCDMLLTPTAPTTAYSMGKAEPNPVATYSADICTVTANISGLPAISTTCGYDSKGLPIGMSLIGRAFDEATILSVADRFEQTFERKEAAI